MRYGPVDLIIGTVGVMTGAVALMVATACALAGTSDACNLTEAGGVRRCRRPHLRRWVTREFRYKRWDFGPIVDATLLDVPQQKMRTTGPITCASRSDFRQEKILTFIGAHRVSAPRGPGMLLAGRHLAGRASRPGARVTAADASGRETLSSGTPTQRMSLAARFVHARREPPCLLRFSRLSHHQPDLVQIARGR